MEFENKKAIHKRKRFSHKRAKSFLCEAKKHKEMSKKVKKYLQININVI